MRNSVVRTLYQQQRLRTAIAHHGRQHQEEQDARREQLTKGGAIL